MKATLCSGCLGMKNHDEFKEAFATAHEMRATGGWYMCWNFFDDRDPRGCKAFICTTCGRRDNASELGIPDAEGNLVPAVACCTQTGTCEVAENFWGKDCHTTHYKMLDYIKGVNGK